MTKPAGDGSMWWYINRCPNERAQPGEAGTSLLWHCSAGKAKQTPDGEGERWGRGQNTGEARAVHLAASFLKTAGWVNHAKPAKGKYHVLCYPKPLHTGTTRKSLITWESKYEAAFTRVQLHKPSYLDLNLYHYLLEFYWWNTWKLFSL